MPSAHAFVGRRLAGPALSLSARMTSCLTPSTTGKLSMFPATPAAHAGRIGAPWWVIRVAAASVVSMPSPMTSRLLTSGNKRMTQPPVEPQAHLRRTGRGLVQAVSAPPPHPRVAHRSRRRCTARGNTAFLALPRTLRVIAQDAQRHVIARQCEANGGSPWRGDDWPRPLPTAVRRNRDWHSASAALLAAASASLAAAGGWSISSMLASTAPFASQRSAG